MAACLPYVGCTTPLNSIITTIMKCTQLTKSRHYIQRYLIYNQCNYPLKSLKQLILNNI